MYASVSANPITPTTAIHTKTRSKLMQQRRSPEKFVQKANPSGRSPGDHRRHCGAAITAMAVSSGIGTSVTAPSIHSSCLVWLSIEPLRGYRSIGAGRLAVADRF